MTRYQEVRQILAGEIGAGHYEVGGRFPTDHELCERFGVSRHTVREALRGLQNQGLLSRRRGAGTTVCERKSPTLFVQTINSMGELTEHVTDSRFESRYEGRIVVRAGLAEILGCEPGQPWLRYAGVRRHVEKQLPLCWTEIFVAEPYFGVREAVDGKPTSSIYEHILSHYGLDLVEIEQEISAVTIGAEQAAEIDAEPNCNGLLVLRRYFTRPRELFEVALSLYPSDRFSFKTNLVNTGA